MNQFLDIQEIDPVFTLSEISDILTMSEMEVLTLEEVE